jgi:hypothetical protein
VKQFTKPQKKSGPTSSRRWRGRFSPDTTIQRAFGRPRLQGMQVTNTSGKVTVREYGENIRPGFVW